MKTFNHNSILVLVFFTDLLGKINEFVSEGLIIDLDVDF